MVHPIHRTRALLALLLTTLLVVAALGPAPPATAADTASISGRVTTGTPAAGVSDVEVTVFRDNGSGVFFSYAWAYTDASGDYSVTSLPAGTYRLRFNAYSGSLAPEYYDDAGSLSTATDITVAEGGAVTGKDAVLDPAAHITGTVTGSGNPVRGVDVSVYAEVNGEWDWAAYDTTDFDGTYDVDGLSPGTYRVRFYDYNDDFVAEWYDGAASLDTADDVTVAKSQTLSGIDADLTPTSRIAGVVTSAGGAPLADIEVTVYALVDGSWEWASWDYTNSSGAYDAGGLTAGSYRVGFRDWGGQYAREFYNDKIDLGSSDAVSVGVAATTSGIDASLANASHITGRLTKPSGAGVSYGDVTVYRLDGGVFEYFDYVETDAGGYYDAGGLNAGTYRVEFYDWSANVGEYWNDKGSLATADNIVVATTGQVVGNINAVLGAPIANPPIVANLAPPTITGVPQVGQRLTASPGSWSPAAAFVSYQWAADGAMIPGATARTYVPDKADVGKTLQVRVAASYPGWSTGFSQSLSTAPVQAKPPVVNTRLPKIKGTLKVGKTVKVTTGSWTPSVVRLKYQWYAGSKKIKHATKKQLTLSNKLVGKRLTVRVTASARGYKSETIRTKPSAEIRR